MQLGSDPRIGPAEGVRVEITDKKNPGRVAGEFLYQSSDPLPGGYVAVEQPQAWVFLRDGRTAHIRADSGKLFVPANQPESGTVVGNVVARLFDKRPDGKRIDLSVDTPAQTMTTDSLTFNSTLGEVNTSDRFVFDSAQGQAVGTGLKLVFNQVRERLEFMRIEKGERIVVRRQASAPKPAPKAPAAAAKPAAAPPAVQAAAAPAAEPSAPVETLYQIVFADSVVVANDQRTIRADMLQSWVRTLDNQLPADAMMAIKIVPAMEKSAKPGASSTSAAPPQSGSIADASSPVPAAPATAPAGLPAPTRTGATSPEGDLVLTWTGPCTIAPLDQTPAELKIDHLALRFTADKSGLVELDDAARGATGHAASIDYSATSGRLAMAGPGPASVLLKLPASGESLEAVRLEFNLATGIGHIPGPGVLAKSPGDPKVRQQVSWAEQADFMLETRGEQVVQAIKQATCTGNVRFLNGADTLRGEYARVDFVSADNQPSTLARVILKDGVVGESEKSGSLRADQVDVAFQPGRGGDPEPTVLTALGHVRAQSEGSELTSDFLEARFGPGPGPGSTKSDVVSATARGAVLFTNRPENVSAAADEMIADLHWKDTPPGAAPQRMRRVDLLGERVSIARADQTTITGTQMRLDGIAKSLNVFGAGTFEHNEEGRSPVAGPSVVAAWTKSMVFDDATGLVDCAGQVEATAWPEPFTRDRINADRVRITLGARSPGDAASDRTKIIKEKKRSVRTAHAFGSILDREDGANAQVESIRFAPDTGAPNGIRQEQVYYVEGPRILADHETGMLDVPDPGRIVLSDRRPQDRPAESRGPTPSGDARGDTLLDWDGSMTMDRGAGRMDILRNVRLTHRALSDEQITNLICEHLIAVFLPSKRSASQEDPQAGPTGLVTAVADGAVYASSGPQVAPGKTFRPQRELIADHAEYDAAQGVIKATAAQGNQVTMFDAASGTPQSAASLVWDLRTDRITVSGPQTVTQPITSPR